MKSIVVFCVLIPRAYIYYTFFFERIMSLCPYARYISMNISCAVLGDRFLRYIVIKQLRENFKYVYYYKKKIVLEEY